MKITIMRDSKAYHSKPNDKEMGMIRWRMAQNQSKDSTVTESLEDVVKDIEQGFTIGPAVCPAKEGAKGTKANDFISQRLFMIDIDNARHAKDEEGNKITIQVEKPLTVDEVISRLAEKNLPVLFCYETFSSKPEWLKFRVALVSDETFTERAERDKVMNALIEMFLPASDSLCASPEHVFYATDKGICYSNFNAICMKSALLALPTQEQQLEAKTTESPKTVTPDKSSGKNEQTKKESKEKLLEDIGKTIGEGDRNDTLKKFATALLTAYGDTALTQSVFLIRAKDCVPALEEREIKTIWNGSRKHFREKIETDPAWNPPDGYHKPNHYTRLYQKFKQNHEYLVYTERTDSGEANDTLYLYENGVWKPKSEGELDHELSTNQAMIPDPAQVKKARLAIMSTGTRINSEKFNADEDLVCFQNGVYRLSTGERLPHSADFHFSLQLNANIPDEILPTPYWDMCLNNIGDADVRQLIYEISGAVLSNVPLYRYKKGILMYGVGDSGKSQVKEVLQMILGEGNYNNVDLQSLEQNRFSSSSFQRVRLGGTNELSHMKIAELKKFKLLTGGDSVEAERKHQSSFSFRFKGLLWFLSNNLPLFGGDRGDHVYNRWILIECKNSIPEGKKVKDLAAKMFSERDSFCVKALQAFQRTVENNYTFTVPTACQMSRSDYQTKNSPLRMFMSERCEPFDPKKHNISEHTTGMFWFRFKNWCVENLYHTPNKAEFRKELAEICQVKESELERLARIDKEVGRFYPVVALADRETVNSDFDALPDGLVPEYLQ